MHKFEIHLIMSRPDFNLLQALRNHRAALHSRTKRLDRLIDTIDQTIATIKGEWVMTEKEYFEGFDETRYEDEVKERWGSTPQHAESQRKWSGYSKEQKDAIKAEGGEIAPYYAPTA